MKHRARNTRNLMSPSLIEETPDFSFSTLFFIFNN